MFMDIRVFICKQQILFDLNLINYNDSKMIIDIVVNIEPRHCITEGHFSCLRRVWLINRELILRMRDTQQLGNFVYLRARR